MTGSGVRGWCPSLYQPMQAGDGLLVRVKPPLSRLGIPALRGLAEAAACHGNGIIEITGRGNLQLRGLTPSSLGPFTARMRDLGLASATPEIERVRNIAVSPLTGDDPAIASETPTIVQALAEGLIRDARLHALPGKFGFAVDGGGVLPMAAPWADITLRSVGGDWMIIPHGAAQAARASPTGAAAAALALARAGLTRRLRALIADGQESALFAAAGLTNLSSAPTPTTGRITPGTLPYAGSGRGAVLAAPRFGQLDAGTTAGLAEQAARFGCDGIRLVPSRLLALSGLRQQDLAPASEALAGLGMIVDARDPAFSIVACQGAPRCASGHANTHADAELLANRLGDPVTLLHLSGCEKGCAHPRPAPFTLTGGPDGYALILQGGADATPVAHRLSPGAALAIINQHRRGKAAA